MDQRRDQQIVCHATALQYAEEISQISVRASRSLMPASTTLHELEFHQWLDDLREQQDLVITADSYAAAARASALRC